MPYTIDRLLTGATMAEAEERTHRWGKLASIATLAAGAAHELCGRQGALALAEQLVRHLEQRAREIARNAPVAARALQVLQQEAGVQPVRA